MPSGAFTVDSAGEILVGTVSGEWLDENGPAIAQTLAKTFASAEEQGFPVSELIIEYGGLKLTARNLRGGALVFLAPVA